MTDTDEYRLSIDAWSPDTIPMERLAAYMAEFARVLGEMAAVHYKETAPGSAQLVASVDSTGVPKVETRMLQVRSDEAPAEARKGLKAIDDMMRVDNAVGAIIGPDNVVYVDFEGRTRPKPLTFGPFKERHSLDGQIVKIGGIDATVPVWLKEGDAIPQICEATVEMSTRLANHYRKGSIRVHGVGTWTRGGNGAWRMQKFKIENFDPLDDKPLADVVRELQSVGGSRWHEAADPLKEARRLRSGDD